MLELRLEAQEFADLTRWRWVLTDASGVFIADHEVRLDPGCWQYEAFTDLQGYLSWRAAPDHRRQDEARITGEVGAWIGSQVLGDRIVTELARARPVTVQVVVPPEAEALLSRPLELAHADGRPLSLQDITLVMNSIMTCASPDNNPAPSHGADVPAGGRLRVLGLFSMPEGGMPLNLRRERYELVRLIRRIDATGWAADVRVLQYGVTRDRLRDVLEEAEGWDVIHISGHGAPGELLLETPGGRPDRIGADELADLLDLARERVKLVTVSACWSAAMTAAEQRRLLGLPVPDQRLAPAVPGNSAATGSLAAELAGRLGCAVLAMRYPVNDDFAIALSGKLYQLLAEKGQPLPRAVGLTLRELAGQSRCPALSLASPAIFGRRAAGLRLPAPPRRHSEYSYDVQEPKLPGFDELPERFVGRTGVMARASAALAPASQTSGVLLHGMPGGGKTACALELAYGHEHAFESLVWYKAPNQGSDIAGALHDFALTLERYLNDFHMTDAVADKRELDRFLPRLTALMRQARLLIIIDNAESLLTGSGQWRDKRWGQVIGALTAHSGLGRMIITSRYLPAETTGLRVEAVDALSPDEALLLTRELPGLHRLIDDGLPGITRDTARVLALGILNMAYGNPEMLKLADKQAAHPERLTKLIESGDQAWRERGGLPEGFFTTGVTTATGKDYLHLLDAWTRTITATLSPGDRDLFWFLCCLEEADRIRPVLVGNWADLWERLGREGEPPALDQALTAITSTGLAAIRRETEEENESYPIHPGVAAAGRTQAGQDFRDAVDTEAGAYWDAVFAHASGRTGGREVDTRLLVRAGLSASPYLIRQQQWIRAAVLLDHAFVEDPSRANASAVLPAIEQITAHEPQAAGTLARVLQVIDPAAAENQLRGYLQSALARGNYRAASVAASVLIGLCFDSGRLAEALTLTDQKIGYTRQAGLGPWTQLSDQGQRLQIIAAMGHAAQVFDQVQQLRDHMQTLPAAPDPDEAVVPWDVRETLLDTGRDAALQLGRWQDALDLNAAIITSLRDRNAPATELAQNRFNDYAPLLRLSRTESALELLLECRHVFQDANDIEMLGKTFSALAAIENERGHGQAVIDLQRNGLRYSYLAGDVESIAGGHHNLGNYLGRYARQPTGVLAGHLTASLIRTLTGARGADRSVQAAAIDLRVFGDATTPPADVAELCRQLGDIPGTDPARLITQLAPDPDTAEITLRTLIAQAREHADAIADTGTTAG